MASWDNLHRAIEAKDPEETEKVWLELLDTDLGRVPAFLDAARRLARQPGGKRESGILLWMLAEVLKEKQRHRDLIDVYVELARTAPDDGTVRASLIEAARQSYPQRADLDGLLEKSGVVGGEVADLANQAETLASYLRMEPGAYVWHKSGWGVGRIVDYRPARGRCVIDFRGKPGHEMDLDAAANRLERLAEDDIRALALSDPKRLRTWANAEPLAMIRQVLERYAGSTNLRHVKDALVPDAVPTSRWSAWWKEARRQAHLDPRFHVSGGRDPKLTYHGSAKVDFRTQVERTLKGCATVEARQAATREFLATATADEEARTALTQIIQAQMEKAKGAASRLGWELLQVELEGGDRADALRRTAYEATHPGRLLATIGDDEIRADVARAMIDSRPDGAGFVHRAALGEDDPVLAEVAMEHEEVPGQPPLVPNLLDEVDSKPAQYPALWAWFVRGLRAQRWKGRSYDPYALTQRLLKVLDAVEYRSRRTSAARDRRGVAALLDVLTSRSGQIVRQAAESGGRAAARHLMQVVEQNRGIKGRLLQKIQTILLRAHPDALREEEVEAAAAAGELHVGERMDRIYMTPGGIERVKRQRDQIVNEAMPENAKEIARAREFGDLSENAEYHAARERQALLQAKADQLSSDLARAVPITPEVVRTDAVSVGARVILRDPDGQEYAYTLLGPPDADVRNRVINYLTPLGQALMGRKPGDHVEVVVEDARRDLQVLAIQNALAPSRQG